MHYFRILTDDTNYADRWFLAAPQTARAIQVNTDLIGRADVERWYSVKNDERIDVFLVPITELQYPLTVFPDGQCEIDPREFTEGRRYVGPKPAVVPIGKEGKRVAFNMAAFDMPVVKKEIAEILSQIALSDIERFPVTVGAGIKGYEIINAVQQVRCVDEARSHVKKWGPKDGRPDKIGQYLEFNPLVIDPSRTGGCHIFRIWGSLIELILSDEVKRALEELDDLGIVFKPV